MPELKKVITGLECCILRDPDDHARCSQCSYESNCVNRLKMDALELLKAQEPRVMTLEEVEDALDTVVWVDRPLIDNTSDEYALIDAYSRKTQIVELRYPFCDKDYRERADYATYGKTWRCWTSRPTDEQRDAVKWDGKAGTSNQ